ncbi:MAG: LamB/YcsF family protein [Kofleriaceae bacterium]
MFLNLDAGELASETEELWRLFDVLNVACGGHAGDASSMARVVEACRGPRPRAGAHPSYPDRAGFGRRSLDIGLDALAAAVAEQCAALRAIAEPRGVTVSTVKPHGALYHDAAASLPLARAVLRGATEALGRAIVVIGPASGPAQPGPHPGASALRIAAEELGLGYAREGFADRGMRGDGTLVPRGEPGSLITDPDQAARQAVQLAGQVDTICLHGDTPGALANARAVRAAIDAWEAARDG